MGKLLSIFFETLPLKKAAAQSIYSSPINWLKQRNIPISKLVGTGFNGVATFSGGEKRSSGKNEEELTTCYLCALSPSLASTSLCSDCQSHWRDQTCLHNFDHPVEVFSLLKKMIRAP